MTPEEVRRALLAREEVALLDVRTEAEYATGHPLFAASLPLDRLDDDIAGRVPRRRVPLVVYDDGGGEAVRAAARLSEHGYRQVSVLDGGLHRWREVGEVFIDVNVPSKAFGELVAEQRAPRLLPASELAAMLEDRADLVVLDARREDEYETMSIPSAVSLPGGELVLRAALVAPDPATTIVVNCAGRTRSIIGAQSLVNAGYPNAVAALENGTIGWTLAGLSLERGQTRFAPPRSDVPEELAGRVRALADRAGVARTDLTAAAELDGEGRTLYRFDVRTPAEYAAGHPPGFRSAPGGQLIQETDAFAPVRGALILVGDRDGVRANMAGSWLAQMGWDVVVVDPWSERAEVAEPDAGRPRPPRPSAGATYRRPYEGTDVAAEAMRAYLEWEFGLVEQLGRDGTHGFNVA